jgi:hypothetical protein
MLTMGGISLRVRVALVGASTVALLGVVGAAFWYGDLRYSRPTPRPATLVQPPIGATLPGAEWLTRAGVKPDGRPILIHFFNADCPCSRFNLEHLHKLEARFGDRVQFVAAVQSDADGSASDQTDLRGRLESLHLGIPHFIDQGAVAAHVAGVYSTPQAVILDADSRLTFRGNYNASRFCTDPRTEFARIALESLIGDVPSAPHPSSRPAAISAEQPAYGCQLPADLPPATETSL